jgi:hypothetical protein
MLDGSTGRRQQGQGVGLLMSVSSLRPAAADVWLVADILEPAGCPDWG